MTCRHQAGDPNCGSHPSNIAARAREDADHRAEAKKREYEAKIAALPATPDSQNFFIEGAADVGPHLVLRVKYPNCKNCAYEGSKVMVYLNVSPIDALKWKTIDPHFRNSELKSNEAPSPSARFPGSVEGWGDAIAYAESKNK